MIEAWTDPVRRAQLLPVLPTPRVGVPHYAARPDRDLGRHTLLASKAPAKRVGFEFEDPELPAEMVKEVSDQPGALALISFTAAKLWELRDRHFQVMAHAHRKMAQLHIRPRLPAFRVP